jgi:hypothetical protein
MSDVEEKVDQLQVGLGVLKVDVAVLKADVSVLKRDLHEVRQDIKDVRTHQERDFRLLFGTVIAVTLGLAGLMAKGFGWLH